VLGIDSVRVIPLKVQTQAIRRFSQEKRSGKGPSRFNGHSAVACSGVEKRM
jgi:hypothetical protein